MKPVHAHPAFLSKWLALFQSKGTFNLIPFHSAPHHDPRVMPFPRSPPESNQPGPICLYKQEAKVGDGTWPWRFWFLYIPPTLFPETFQ